MFCLRFFIDCWIFDMRETRLSGTIKAGTIMMKAGTIIPQSLRVETELYSQGWEILKNADADAVDRDIRRADWNFFFLASSIQATALGSWGERTVRKAMERVLAKAELAKFNCLEITEVSAKRFLGFPTCKSRRTHGISRRAHFYRSLHNGSNLDEVRSSTSIP